MKKLFPILTLLIAVISAAPAMAADVMLATTMQPCNTAQECKLVTNSCSESCGTVPVNLLNLPAAESAYQARCGKSMAENIPCTMNPPMAAACINNRCTIDYAYANNADKNDYKPGAYGVPPAAVPSEVKGDYSRINDRDGRFTAYDLPQTEVRQSNVGEIVTKVYVPPSSPVSGGNYVPVTGGAPAQAPVHAAPAPVAAPAPAPAPAPVAAPVPAPAPTPAPAAVVPPHAVVTPPAPSSTVPAMSPSKPNQLPPTGAQTAPVAPVAAPPVAAPAAQVPVVPPVADPTPVPRAPDGKPIPPSDLKPEPTYVPPAGVSIPVGPNDPGAPPSPGTFIKLKDTDAVVPPAEGSKKSFSNKADKEYQGSAGSFN